MNSKETYRHHMICARATLFPDKTLEEVQEIVDKLSETMGFDDEEDNEKSVPRQYVWVTYDPLLEKVVCVHDKLDSRCDKCKKIWERREAENSLYQLESQKFLVKP